MIRYLDTERAIQQIINDNNAFLRWIDDNVAAGFVINWLRCKGADADEGFIAPRSYMKLHRASCWMFRAHNPRWSKNYTATQLTKVCSSDREKLIEWATRIRGESVPACGHCEPV